MKWVAELAGLTEKLEVHPFDLNPTEKKFCTIGSVIMMNLDEPTCGLEIEKNYQDIEGGRDTVYYHFS